MVTRLYALALVFLPALVAGQPLPAELRAVIKVPASSGRPEAYVVLDTVLPAPVSPIRIPLEREDNLEPSAVLLGPETPSPASRGTFTLLAAHGRACVVNVAKERPLGHEIAHTQTVWRRALRVTSTTCNPSSFSWALAGTFHDLSYLRETRLELDQLGPHEQRAIRAQTRRYEYVLGLARLPSRALHVTFARRGTMTARTVLLDQGRVTARFPGIASWAFVRPQGLAFYGYLSKTKRTQRLWPR